MDISVLLTSFADAIRPLAAARSGTVQVASDPDHVVEILCNSPAGWRLILSLSSSTAVDPEFSPGINRLEFNVTVQAARGLSIDPGADTHTTVAGRDPLLTLAELASQWMRGLTGEHPDIQSKGVREVSRQWLVVENLPTRQINLIFALRIASENPIPVPVTFP